MLIPQNIIQDVQEDPVSGAVSLIDYVEAVISNGNSWQARDRDLLFETYALTSALQEAKLIEFTGTLPNTNRELKTTCAEVWKFLIAQREQLQTQAAARKFVALKQHFALTVANTFGYEFSDGDVKRIQTLLNELRDLVAAAGDIEDSHKQRLLKRLEQLQSELHKKTSDLSRYYGLLGEAGVALGRFGNDAKPIVDRIKEILQITWNTQARAEELPSGTTPPLLEKDSE